MSAQPEAPEINGDPVTDSSDLYVFVSPDAPETVTIIANYVPAGGADFVEFGDDVLYELHLDVNGDARPDLTYQFRFRTELRDDTTFLYNTGPIESLDSANWNRRQFFSVTVVDAYGKSTVLAERLPCPPCNVGRRSIPAYEDLARAAVASLPTGERVFAGQRADAFFVDLGYLRPPGDLADRAGRLSVNSIALQLPITAAGVIGVWTTASRRSVQVDDAVVVGPYTQVSRLGNPLFKELIVPPADRDRWNALPPTEDKLFAHLVERPELQRLLLALHPGTFDRLASLDRAGTPRTDLVAMLLTGFPDGMIDGFRNHTGDVQADLLRLDTAVPPAELPSRFGLLGGDPAGYPNGRRITDDVVSISLRAVAGITVPLIDPSYEVDAAATLVEQGFSVANAGAGLLPHFPYLGTPSGPYSDPAAGSPFAPPSASPSAPHSASAFAPPSAPPSVPPSEPPSGLPFASPSGPPLDRNGEL
ncbi:DUF4331 domain-containing protein [Actinoplanes solisilvae]|uniref:DUF4331 domain-containing protein n=1 Tax=Actinoplanes solisilvae TaxID=2486853 RepID=UPI00196A71C0|nr:DUF4331 domain-containing protein [Actinoplanes solisilvae]